MNTKKLIVEEAINNYHDALKRLEITKINFETIDEDLFEVANDELSLAEKNLNDSIKRLKLLNITI